MPDADLVLHSDQFEGGAELTAALGGNTALVDFLTRIVNRLNETITVVNQVRSDTVAERVVLATTRTLANELKTDLNALRSDVSTLHGFVVAAGALADELKADLSAHTHGGVTAGVDNSAAAATISAADVGVVTALAGTTTAAADVGAVGALSATTDVTGTGITVD